VTTKRIKKSITEKEYKLLMNHTKGDDSLKEFNRKRLLQVFCLLYYSGARVNELSQIKYKHIYEIMETGETVIVTFKTKNERILYFSEKAIKEIKKYFELNQNEDHYIIASWNDPKTRLHEISLINLVNTYMKKVLGEGFTSHSFRQGLLTEMGAKSINPKIIQSFIGHSDVKTTLRYIKPTADDVKMALVR
jgi:integrase/recombinase XerD